jgi:hypothetical protein
MKYIGPVLLTVATILSALTIAIVGKSDYLKEYIWAVPYLLVVIALSVGSAVIAFIKIGRQQVKEKGVPAASSVLRDINVDAKPHQEQNVYIGSEFFRQPEAPQPKSAPAVTPLLEVIDDKAILIACNGGEWYEEDRSNPHLISNKLNAHILVFRKKPALTGEASPPLHRVTAHLTFRGRDGSQLLIDFGTWLREYTHYVDFMRAETHALVLSTGVRASGKVDENVYALDNPHQTDPRKARFQSGIRIIKAPTEKPLMANCCEVEIVVVAGNTTVYHDTFKFSLDPEGTMRSFGSAI